MEWSFDGPNGAVTVCQEGERAICRAICPDDRGGPWKAWLRGEGGKALLGTLVPEGGAMRLRRSIDVAQLERQGAWPPTGAELVLMGAAARGGIPSGWQWTDCPGRLVGDAGVRKALHPVERALIQRDGEGFRLALPFVPGGAFPIPALFCLSRVEVLNGKRYVLFQFSRRGCPRFMGDP